MRLLVEVLFYVLAISEGILLIIAASSFGHTFGVIP